MFRNHFWIAPILLFTAAHCGQTHAQALVAAPKQVLADIAYKPNAKTEYERERCTFDLYLPNQSDGFSTLVWFHGGGLQNGHKADDIAVGLAKRFAADGMAVASVNYRLSPKVQFPAYLDDAAAAVAAIRKQIVSHGGSKDAVFVSGHSAGGYLAAMLGMDTKYLARYDVAQDAVAGYIPVSGQMITHSTVRRERNLPPRQPLVDAGAPLFHVSSNASPFLCIAGSEDLPARAEENRYFVAAMKAVDHQAIQYLEVAGRDHGTIASRMKEADDTVALAIKEFIRQHARR